MSNKSLKLMGLGISIMLAGIYIYLDPGLDQRMSGGEFFIGVIGFIIILVGFFMKD